VRDVEEPLRRAAGPGIADCQVVQVGLLEAQACRDRFGDLGVHGGAQVRAPLPGVGGLQLERAQGYLALRRLGPIPGLRAVEPDDDGLAAAVQEEVAHGIAERAVHPQTTEDALEVSEAVDDHRGIGRTAQRAADERRDGCGHPGDGTHPTGHFLDVDAWIGRCNWHERPL
jgi:hypothetical protein